MSVVGIIVDGKWDGRPPANDIDQIVAHLAEVVRIAQNLSPEDARRARDFFHAAWGMLSATTSLPTQDQARFARALRERSR